jgi:putative sigma-54 modulation protein
MVVTFTGKPEDFTREQSAKLAARFDKAGKLIDGKDEKKAHVILSKQRHLHKAEITIQLLGHPVVSAASGSDCYEALCAAVDKLEAQALKLKKKLIDGKKNGLRASVAVVDEAPVAAPAKKAPAPRKPRLYRVRAAEAQKPMTAEEAMLEFTKRDRVMVFTDPESGRPGVLIRRDDGNFDLVET